MSAGRGEGGVETANGVESESSDIAHYDAAPVNSAEHRALYQKREQIYPKTVHGTFRSLKWVILILTLGVYYILPWIRWPRGVGEPDQAVLVDFAGSRFYFFFIELWPSELYFVTGLLILAAIALFLATALFGRVWCGYACPQTVWTDLFLFVERHIEGDRNKRMRLDNGPWTSEKITKKVSKHLIWILIAFATGGAWVFYFHDAPTIFKQLFTGEAPGSAYLFAGILTFTTYMLAGTMREQVCTYMCPWPRIQAALTDEETMQVTYKYDRGEPRGAHKKGTIWDGRGDCIDCKACVVVCPMGIDIREGAQLECINCALCIDACDDIMKKIDRPLGLIGYDTDKNLENRIAGKSQSIKLIRSRTIFYASILIFITGIMIAGLASRAGLVTSIERDRTPPFVQLSDGSVRNAYTVKVTNKSNTLREYRLDLDAANYSDNLEMKVIGEDAVSNSVSVDINGDNSRLIRVLVTSAPGTIKDASIPVTFTVRDTVTGETVNNSTIFMQARGQS